MSKLFVANPTRQNHLISLRLPERAGIVQQNVAPGRQIQFFGELSTPELEAILKHGATYGWVSVTDLSKRGTPFASLVYSIDRPVPRGSLMGLIENNTRVLKQRGKENRDLAAVAMSQDLEAMVESETGAHTREVNVEIVEDDSKPRAAEDDHEAVAEGRKITRDANEDEHNQPTRGKGKNK